MQISVFISLKNDEVNIDGEIVNFSDLENNQYPQIKNTGQNRPVFFIWEENLIKNEIILNADQKYRIDSLEDLKNQLFSLDLALGIWYNKQKKQLIVARDIFGFTPVYYILIPNEFFAFSTSLPVLLENVYVKSYTSFNHSLIHKYITPWSIKSLINSETMFSSIESVLPGHYLDINLRGATQVSYLNYQPDRWRGIANNIKELGITFKEIFSNSLINLVKDTKHIGMHLSGGLDSSSICSTIKSLYPERKLSTFYLDPLVQGNTDIPYAKAVVDHISSEHFIVSPNVNYLNIFEQHIQLNGQPSMMISGPVPGSLLRKAAEMSGCNVLLSGHGGDNIVGHGLDFISHMFQQQDWEILNKVLSKRAMLAEPYNYEGEWEKLALSKREELFFDNYITTQLLNKRNIKEIISTLISVGRISTLMYYLNRLGVKIIDKIIHGSLTDFTQNRFYNSTYNTPHFGFELSGELKYSNQEIIGKIYGWTTLRINEEMGNMNENSINQHYPFYNRDLLELSLAVSSELKYNNGLTRGVLREAMKDLLPPMHLKRVDKFAFDHFSKHVTLKLYKEAIDLFVSQSDIWLYVNKSSFYKAVKILERNAYSALSQTAKVYVLRSVSFAIWLNWFKNK